MKPYKVLIVDDSALIRSILNEILGSDPELRVVGMASDPYEAREMIKKFQPDVLTLDVEMPKMDGIAFLRNLMRLRPIPVVMISTLTHKGAPLTLEALEIGAVDFVGKPVNAAGQVAGLDRYAETIIEKVKGAATANVQSGEAKKMVKQSPPAPKPLASSEFLHSCVLAIGASTGGTEAIKDVIVRMPPNSPPIVITQHIPAGFSTSYAERLDRLSKISVKEAATGDVLAHGHAYLAPGSHHLLFKKNASGRLTCILSEGDPVNRHRPSVEVMYDSLLEHVRPKYLAYALLTGMGADGAAALKRARDAGVYTIAQNEQTSVVWGMPGAAVKLGGADDILPLDKISDALLKFASKA
jgi:two-component system, chemotaxis family, protein-glutamate methylesterase/glutaminase